MGRFRGRFVRFGSHLILLLFRVDEMIVGFCFKLGTTIRESINSRDLGHVRRPRPLLIPAFYQRNRRPTNER